MITGHPLDDDETADVAELRTLETRGVTFSDPSEFLNVEVDGNTVTFDQLFTNNTGNCFLTVGDQVTVEDGKIIEYAWATSAEVACE